MMACCTAGRPRIGLSAGLWFRDFLRAVQIHGTQNATPVSPVPAGSDGGTIFGVRSMACGDRMLVPRDPADLPKAGATSVYCGKYKG